MLFGLKDLVSKGGLFCLQSRLWIDFRLLSNCFGGFVGLWLFMVVYFRYVVGDGFVEDSFVFGRSGIYFVLFGGLLVF